MPVRVPYLPAKTIEKDAENLLSEYEREKGVRLELAIPVDVIASAQIEDQHVGPVCNSRRNIGRA